MKRISMAALIAFLAITSGNANSETNSAYAVRPAIDGILAAFHTHPLVGLGDSHEIAQEEDFYAALVRDRRFAREVGNVVVEFGGAAHQDIIDRYLNGQDVSYTDLRKVWTDGVGFNFPAAIGYINFFVQVRAVNLTLPPNQRIHVWLGDPPIDWSKIKTQADFQPIQTQRDSHAAEVIEKKILGKDKKALVIYGDPHFFASFGLRRLVEQKYPNTFYIVQMYTGYSSKSCTASFEKNTHGWPNPGLAAPVRDTPLEGKLYRPGCDVGRKMTYRFSSSVTEAQRSKIIEDDARELTGADADALLFLGNAATLTYSPIEPSIYLDPGYRREMNRRAKAGFGIDKSDGEPLTEPLADSTVEMNPVSPQYIHRY